MAKQIEYVLNIDVNKSLNSLGAIKKEMREVGKAMQDASNSNNQQAYDQLSKRFVDLRENAEDLNQKLQPMDQQIGTLTRGIGAMANVGSNLAMVLGADAKSSEELFKTFAKVQGITNVVNGMNELVDLGPKMASSFKVVGTAMKAAFASNPVGIIVVAVLALGAAIVALTMDMNTLSKEQQMLNDINEEGLKNSVEERTKLNLLKDEIKNTTVGTKERAEAIKKLNTDFKEYIGYTVSATASEKELQNVYNDTEAALIKKAKAEAAYNKLVEIETEKQQRRIDLQNEENEGWLRNTFESVVNTAQNLSGLGVFQNVFEGTDDITADIEELNGQSEFLTKTYQEINSEITKLIPVQSWYNEELKKEIEAANQITLNNIQRKKDLIEITNFLDRLKMYGSNKRKTELEELENWYNSELEMAKKAGVSRIAIDEEYRKRRKDILSSGAADAKVLTGAIELAEKKVSDLQIKLKQEPNVALLPGIKSQLEDAKNELEMILLALERVFKIKPIEAKIKKKTPEEVKSEEDKKNEMILRGQTELNDEYLNYQKTTGEELTQFWNNNQDMIIDTAYKTQEILGGLATFYNDKMEAELNRAEGNEEKQLAIRKKYAKKRKAIDIAMATVGTGLATVQIWKADSILPQPFDAIFRGVQTALLLATLYSSINKMNSVQFAKGGILNGPSHANGGILTQFGELEGGEAVINRQATQRFSPVLSAINQSTGGRAIGGSSGSLIDYDLLASKINDKRVVLVSSDVTIQQGRDKKISARATF